eukprot:6118858-Pleurochrysis_carterae.AAC.3
MAQIQGPEKVISGCESERRQTRSHACRRVRWQSSARGRGLRDLAHLSSRKREATRPPVTSTEPQVGG